MAAIFTEVKVKYIDKTEVEGFDLEGVAFFNVNTEENLKRARFIAEDMGGLII